MSWDRPSLVRQLREWGVACDEDPPAACVRSLLREIAERADLPVEARKEACRPLEYEAAMEAYWPGVTEYARAVSSPTVSSAPPRAS